MTRLAPLHRPAVRYFGGKWHLAPWIVSAFPAHHTYVEAFGGGASVLLRKPRSAVEVLNDLDSNVVSLYRVLADPALSKELGFQAWLTPYRKSVFKDLKRFPDPQDDLGRALRLVVRGAMSMSSSTRSGYRVSRSREQRVKTPAEDWYSYRHSVPGFHARMRAVTITSEPAVEVMLRHAALRRSAVCPGNAESDQPRLLA
ncbi:DNA adenine methylase [Aureimonas glaciei]|uniref:DNA adenine methylase n=1 Tax=Aureimonas glaciei TaxID=1776957 RepID=A0A916Y475_9HYPH|nr:DNA adenine methylase [Aureimonas glaciei]GGD28884.1 hypothetical protein GCM10011335_35070 [Aureimonas glaciei]